MITWPHTIETCYGSRLHCFTHNLDESDTNAFRACLECAHVFATESDLVIAYNAFLKILSAQEQMFPATVSTLEWGVAAKEINKLIFPDDNSIAESPTHIECAADAYSCPYCLHDF